MELRPELMLSRWENFYRCPGIVLALAGFLFAASVSPLVQLGLLVAPTESPIPELHFSPVSVFCAFSVFGLIFQSDRRGISALRLFLLVGVVAIGASDIFGKIEYPSSLIESYPRFKFSDYVSTLAMAILQGIMMLVWLALLSAPSVRRWVQSGVRTDEEAVELLAEKKKMANADSGSLIESEKPSQYGSFESRFEKRKLSRVSSYLCLGFLSFLVMAYVALVIGRPVPSPVGRSFESLMEQLETEDHWQLRVRREVNEYVSSKILHFPDAVKAKMPPSSVTELRLEAVMGLAGSGTRAVKPLLKVLSESDEKIRIEAARSLGVIGKNASEASETLRAMILNPSLPSSSEGRLWQKENLRHELASALLQIAHNDLLTLETIVKGLELTNGLSLIGLIPDLSEIGTANAMLANLLLGEVLLTGDETIVFSVLRDLRSIDINQIAPKPTFFRKSTLVEIATQLLFHSDPTIRRESALLLSGVSQRAPALTEQMVALILDPHPVVGIAAIHAIETWREPAGGQTVAKLNVYLDRLVDSDRSIVASDYWEDSASLLRPAKGSSKMMVMHSSHLSLHEFGFVFSAMRPSGSYDHVKRNLNSMMRLNELETVTVRRMLIRALGVQGREVAVSVPRLREFVSNSEAPERWEAAIALWKITQNPEDSLPVLESFVKDSKSIQIGDPRFEILFGSVEIFGEIGDEALPSLSELLAYKDKGLRLKAFLEIEKLLRTNPSARSVVESLVNDSYISIRLRAQKAIARLNARR